MAMETELEEHSGGDCISYIAVVIRIFRISTSCDPTGRSNTGVDAIYAPERVDIDFEIGKRLVRAGLEGGCITPSIHVECMYACQYRVAIFSGSTSTSIGGDISRRVPVALDGGEMK